MHLVDDTSTTAFIRARDSRESRRFLVGLGHGIWMSAVLTLALYWIAQIFS
jgi:hypothetical protein